VGNKWANSTVGFFFDRVAASPGARDRGMTPRARPPCTRKKDGAYALRALVPRFGLMSH